MAGRGLDRHDEARECNVEEAARGICYAADGSRDRRGVARVHGETQGGIPRLERLNMAENIACAARFDIGRDAFAIRAWRRRSPLCRVQLRIVSKNALVIEGDASRRSEIRGNARTLLNSNMQRKEPRIIARGLARCVLECV